MVEMTALEAFPLSDRNIPKGHDFDVDEQTATVLLAIGKAKLKERTLHVRQTYRRRDMKAEE